MARMVSSSSFVKDQADSSADEIANLKQEAAAFREVRQNLGEEDGPRRVFDKVSLTIGSAVQSAHA